MPERPLLILPAPGEPAKRRNRGGGGGNFQSPGRERQAERLNPQFELLQRAMEARRVRLQAEAQGLIPEEVIVLETIGTVENFIRAVERVPGMEWLGEIEEEDIPPDDDFFAVGQHGQARQDKPLSGRLFLIVTNQEALRQMLSLWEVWQRGERFPPGLVGGGSCLNTCETYDPGASKIASWKPESLTTGVNASSTNNR